MTRTNTEDNIQTETWLRRQYIRMLVYCNTAMLMPDSTGVGKYFAAAVAGFYSLIYGFYSLLYT